MEERFTISKLQRRRFFEGKGVSLPRVNHLEPL